MPNEAVSGSPNEGKGQVRAGHVERAEGKRGGEGRGRKDDIVSE